MVVLGQIEETRSWISKIRELAEERGVTVEDKLDTFDTSSIELDLGRASTATIWGFNDSNDFKDDKPQSTLTYSLATSQPNRSGLVEA